MQAERVCILYYVFVCVCVCVCVCVFLCNSKSVDHSSYPKIEFIIFMHGFYKHTHCCIAEQVMNFMVDPIQCDYFKYLVFLRRQYSV